MIPQGLLHMCHEPWHVGKNILYFNVNFNFLNLLLQKTMFKAPKMVGVLKGPKGKMILGIILL
jgi:hypothetical protein